LITTREPEEVQKYRGAAEAVMVALPQLASRLDPVIAALQDALARSVPDPRFEGLLEGAKNSQRTLLERAPDLFAAALRRVENVDAERARAADLARTTTEALEAMAAQSADTTRTFAELASVLAEHYRRLRELNAALDDLPRADARAFQRDSRRATASAALCRNLYAAKMRDRAAGRLPLPSKTAEGTGAAHALAVAIIAADYDAAHALLAPWLRAQWSPEVLRARISARYALVAAASEDKTLPPAADYRASRGLFELAELRNGKAVSVPDEVTEESFDGRWYLEILSEEEDAFFTGIDQLASFWLVAVKTDGGPRVGSLEIDDQ
jgi:hypothetical protein